MSVSLLGRVIAYGTPALLILLGFSAWTSGKLAEMVFGTSEGIAVGGIILMFLGVVIYVLEILLR